MRTNDGLFSDADEFRVSELELGAREAQLMAHQLVIPACAGRPQGARAVSPPARQLPA